MTEAAKIYEFEDFRLDMANEVLQRNGSNISITRKMLETLYVLVENADRLVEKQELMQRIWHDRFVEESNLTFNIKMLRKALGDNAAEPTYIETIPRRGYRFIAKVREASPTLAKESSDMPVLGKPQPRRSYRTTYLVATIIAIAVIGSLGFSSLIWRKALLKSSDNIFPDGFRATKISETGMVYHAVISPDGKYVAYTNTTNGKQGLWLRHLETSYNMPLLPPSDDIYHGLAFSRDSSSVYFVRTPDAGRGSSMIYRIPVVGGVPVGLIEGSQGWISVSPDDQHISFIRIDEGAPGVNRLLIADVDGGNVREIEAPDEGNSIWAHAFSPDGKTIAAVYGNTSTASRNVGIVEINVATGERREIMKEKFFHIKDVEWLPDQRSLLFSADERIGETCRLWQLDYDSGHATAISSDLTNYSNITINHDSSLVLTTTFLPDFRLIVRTPANPDELKPLTQARDRFAFSPHGKIVYASDASGNEDIWIMDSDGSNQRQLTTDSGLDFFPIVSSHGRHVYFTSNRTGESQVWRMNIDGSNQIQITHVDGGYARFETLDGRGLYYQSAISEKLMKVDLQTGEETVFPGETGYFQSVSSDGRLLAILLRDPDSRESKIRIIDVESAEVLKTFSVPAERGYVNFLRWKNKDVIGYAMNARAGDDTIWTQNINETSPRLLQTLDDDGFLDLQFSNDGNSVGFIRGRWNHDALLLTSIK